jgi:hypothetical protein
MIYKELECYKLEWEIEGKHLLMNNHLEVLKVLIQKKCHNLKIKLLYSNSEAMVALNKSINLKNSSFKN